MATKKATTNEDISLGILSHILGLFTGFLGPLIIYLVAQEGLGKSNAREALNWQISLMIYFVVSAILIFLLLGILLLIALLVVNLIFCIIGAVRANDGQVYYYPLTIRFLR